jgi:hypothetical protein
LAEIVFVVAGPVQLTFVRMIMVLKKFLKTQDLSLVDSLMMEATQVHLREHLNSVM